MLSIREPFAGLRFGLGGTIGVVLCTDGGATEHPRTIQRLALWLGRDNWVRCCLNGVFVESGRVANHWRTILQLAVGCWLAVGWLLAGCGVLVAACEAAVDLLLAVFFVLGLL